MKSVRETQNYHNFEGYEANFDFFFITCKIISLHDAIKEITWEGIYILSVKLIKCLLIDSQSDLINIWQFI